jgi:GntR family transcriptional regulator/MocR family aminotransferase
MLQIDRLSDTPFYIQIYMYFRKEIEAHRMPAGMKLSSVRELAQTIEVSKMTVEKAYYQLASEGYIIRHNRSRYAVAHLDAIKRDAEPVDNQNVTPVPIRYRYDFGSGDMDLNYFPMTEWRKSMNRVLSHPDALLANMDEQGAPALRQALSQYVLDMRGVKARPENIVISSGTVPLLALLASLLQHDYNRIAVEEPGFKLGRELLRTMGYTITPVALEKGEFSLEALEKSQARVVYVSPSHQFPTGTIMPVGTRYRLLRWALASDGLIIEDDYDSELRYQGRPVPALQSLDTEDRVVYMGSLSKILPPFIRLSFMVLPPHLLERYNRSRSLFRLGASIPEQCALADFIHNGGMARQIRRLRKHYIEKGAFLEGCLREAFGDTIRISPVESGVYCHVTLQSSLTANELIRRAAARGCRVLWFSSFYEHPNPARDTEFLLSFSKIPAHELKEAVHALQQAWSEKEGV